MPSKWLSGPRPAWGSNPRKLIPPLGAADPVRGQLLDSVVRPTALICWMLTLKDSQLLPNVRSVSSTLNNSALCPLEGGSGGVWGSRPHTLSRHSPMGPCGRYVGGSWGIRRNIGTRVQARVRCKSWGGRNFFSFQRHPFGMDNLFSLRGVTFTKMREGWSDRNFKRPTGESHWVIYKFLLVVKTFYVTINQLIK